MLRTFLGDVAGQIPIPPRPESLIAQLEARIGSPESTSRRASIWNARSPCFNPAATTIWRSASDTTPDVAAMLYLGLVSWPLGDIGRAVSVVGDAEVRIAGLAHVDTRAQGKMHAAMFELMRGDSSRAASNASELARLAREHDLPLWRACGVFLEGLAQL